MKQKILITGAGGPAAVTFYRSLSNPEAYDVFMGDMDYCAAGLYLVPETRRVILPRADSPDFISTLLAFCQQAGIAAIIPTVDTELVTISNELQRFEERNIQLYLSPAQSLAICHDKYQLLSTCADKGIETGPFALWQGQDVTIDWSFPLILKDRTGSGGRDIHLVHSMEQLKAYKTDGSYLMQTWLPGAEYSVDVYINKVGKAISAVPRQRLKIDSGIAVTAKTVRNQAVIDYALSVTHAVPLAGAVNVQVKLDAFGQPKLMEINARFPGTMSLTVAAGVNMPDAYLTELFGATVNTLPDFQEIVQVRYWDERTFSIAELDELKPSLKQSKHER